MQLNDHAELVLEVHAHSTTDGDAHSNGDSPTKVRNPFYFEDHTVAHTPRDLLAYCESQPGRAAGHLVRGDFGNWLAYLGETDLSARAREAAFASGDPQDRLRLFVNSCRQLLDGAKALEPFLLDQQLGQLAELVTQYRHHLPQQGTPTLLICGAMGFGKTTTINTLFGRQMGNVGHTTRGTSVAGQYLWECRNQHINIIDLPGLGDSDRHDPQFQEIYREWVKKANSFLVVINPPRPAAHGTLKTIKLLLECGVESRHIVFGFNKLSHLHYSNGGSYGQIRIDGLLGLTEPRHQHEVSQASKQFLADLHEYLRHENRQDTFTDSQVIPYDSLTGWNLYALLGAVAAVLPFQYIAQLHEAARGGQEILEKKEEELTTAKAILDKANKELLVLQSTYAGQQGESEAQKEALAQELRRKEAELATVKQEIAQKKKEIEHFSGEQRKYESSMLGKVTEGMASILERKVNRDVAETVRSAGKAVYTTYDKAKTAVKNTAKKFWNGVKSWFS